MVLAALLMRGGRGKGLPGRSEAQPTLKPRAERMAVRVVRAMLMMTLHLFFCSLFMRIGILRVL